MIELIIAPSSFRLSGDGRNSSHQVFSEIYFQLDGKFFPEKSWDDFVVVILNCGLAIYCPSLIRKMARCVVISWMAHFFSR